MGVTAERRADFKAPVLRATAKHTRRWVMRRALVIADVLSLATAFAVVEMIYADYGAGNRLAASSEVVVFLLLLFVWVILCYLRNVYDHDALRAETSTVDEFAGVFQLVAGGSWFLVFFIWMTHLAHPDMTKLLFFSAIAIPFVGLGRAAARTICKQRKSYVQKTVIVGDDEIAHLVARKIKQHPEYGLDLIGFVGSIETVDEGMLGSPEDLPSLISHYGIERVILAFQIHSREGVVGLARSLRDFDVQIDVVPRYFELFTPKAELHSLEGLTLIGLPAVRLRRGQRFLKRGLDVGAASLMLVATVPLFALIAWRVKRTSSGPVFFRQLRLGQDMKPFTLLKFRTMAFDTDVSSHRDYLTASMDSSASPESNGLFKLDRPDAVTPTGRWLRRWSLDELPQLINVLRGSMSIVGPRPCIPYETEHYEPHHFDRFLVPAGLTGLWQVTARAHSTYVEALEMDVAYAHGWSLGLDLMLLLKTPLQLLRPGATV
jgi:exopolysaccharide biosynthesis polyprenyl glycosylphosphotransferase